MANKLKEMILIRRMLQLASLGKGKKEISRELGISLNTLKGYMRRLNEASLTSEQLLAMDDQGLSLLAYPQSTAIQHNARQLALNELLPGYVEQLQKTHITRELLWEKYIRENPSGYSYGHFCEHLSLYKQRHDAVMHFDHRPGEVMEIDLAGSKLSYVDKETGQVVWCPVLVCVLTYSNYTYAEALVSQKQEHIIGALNRCLSYFGGVPQCMRSDNLKQVVDKPNRYEPDFNSLMEQFALHYGLSLMAARAYRPKDKPSVEGGVNHMYQSVYAVVEQQLFFGLDELNRGVLGPLDASNRKKMQRRGYSRHERFMLDEKPCLRPLPGTAFGIKHTAMAKVQKDYHATLGEDWHHYSVPYGYIGKRVKLVYDGDHVEIYLDLKRIALHKRSYAPHRYTTDASHMPQNHRIEQDYRGYSTDDFMSKAGLIGPNTREYISNVIKSRMFTPQAFRSCIGILRLSKKYTPERTEAACAIALKAGMSSYKYVDNILKNNRDQQKPIGTRQIPIPFHDNIRGEQAYQ